MTSIVIAPGQSATGTPLGQTTSMVVSSGGTAINTTFFNGGSETILAGGTDEFATLSAGGTQFVFGVASGGLLTGEIGFGGRLIVESGGSVVGTTVDFGSQFVFLGGSAISTTLGSGTEEVVNGGGQTSFTSIDGGGTQLTFGTATSATVGIGGVQIVGVGGIATGTVVSGSGNLTGFETVSSGGTAIGTILSGGDQAVAVGAVATGTVVFGGVAFVYGTADDMTIAADGTAFAEPGGGTISGVTVVDSGTLDVYGTAIDATVGTVVQLHLLVGPIGGTSVNLINPGTEEVFGGGVASDTTVQESSTLELFGGARLSGTTTILSGGTEAIGPGYVASGVVVSSGTTFAVMSGGTASNTIVSSGGTFELFSGAIVAGQTAVHSGGTIEAGSGYTLLSFGLSGGAVAAIGSGGTASGTVFKGDTATEIVLSGGTDFRAGVLFGSETVSFGGLAIGDQVSDATQTDYGTVSGTVLAQQGAQEVYGLASGTVIDAESQQTVQSGGTATDATITNYGMQSVLSGGVASGTVLDFGLEYVQSGGLAVSTTVDFGAPTAGGPGLAGGEMVSAGGTAFGAMVSNGGELFDFGSAYNTIVEDGGYLAVETGAIASGTMLDGGTLVLDGNQQGLTWNSGTVEIASGAIAPTSVVSAGGTLIVVSGSVASGIMVSGGGSVTIGSDGTGSAIIIGSGGIETVMQGGSDRGAMIWVSGRQLVSGGTAIDVTVSGGGVQQVASSGTAVATTIESGGSVSVAAGGTASNPVLSGGTLELAGGGATGSITFAAGTSGTLLIDGTAMPAATISGFTSGDTIDLTSLSYAAGDSAILGAGNLLQLAEGNQVYDLDLALGQSYSGDVFTMASDRHGGTDVTERTDTFHIDIDYDLSVKALQSSNPTLYAEFTGGVADAVQYLESLFTNPVTLTFDVGYGEVDNQSLASNALGENEAVALMNVSAASVLAALDAEGAPGSAFVSGTGTLQMSPGEALALGLAPNNGSLDGYAGFSSTLGFDYSDSAPQPGQYDFLGVVEHELTEEMGRTSLLGEPGEASLMDQFRYTATGTLDQAYSGTKGSVAYFSVDGGATELAAWNNFYVPGGSNNVDLGDWASPGPAPNGDDSFNAASSSGVLNIVSQTDIELMEALGWTTTPLPPAMILMVSALPMSGDLGAGATVTITLTMSGSVTVTGTPTLALNDGTVATYQAAQSTATTLAFSYTVGAGQNVAALAVTAVNLPNGATITDAGGNAAGLALPASATFGIQIDTMPPATTPASLSVAGNSAATPIGITAPTDASSMMATVTGLPVDGTVLLSDGTTAVTKGETLTLAQLTSLDFRPIPGQFGRNSTFTYTVTDAAGNSAGGSATLAIEGQNIPTPATLTTTGVTDALMTNAGGALVLDEIANGQIGYTGLGGLGPEWQFEGEGAFLGDGQDQYVLWYGTDDSPAFGTLALGEDDGGAPSYAGIGAIGPEWQFEGIGPIEGGSTADLLIWDSSSASPIFGSLVVGAVSGGQVQWTGIGALGPEWQFEGVGNYLNDGTSDFLIWDTSSSSPIDGSLVVGEDVGGAAQYTLVGGLGPSTWQFEGSGDLLDDGKESFLIWDGNSGDPGYGSLVVGEVNAGAVDYTLVGAVGPQWQFLGVGDYDGASPSEFLLRSSVNGALVLGTIAGGAAGYAQVGAVSPTDWNFHTANTATLA